MSNSWKQYGGVQKTDKFQTLDIGTLIANDVIYKTNTTITTFKNIVADGSITGNALITNQDMYVAGNIYFSINYPQLTSPYGYLYGDSANGTFGVNSTNKTNFKTSSYNGYTTINPLGVDYLTASYSAAAFDILSNKTMSFQVVDSTNNTISSCNPAVLSVRSTNEYVNSILAQNSCYYTDSNRPELGRYPSTNGVSALADSTNAYLAFIVDGKNSTSSYIKANKVPIDSTSNNQEMDFYAYNSTHKIGNNLTLNAAGITIYATNLTRIQADQSILLNTTADVSLNDVNANYDITLDTVQGNINIKSDYVTKILSKSDMQIQLQSPVGISNRISGYDTSIDPNLAIYDINNVNGELVTIYDISTNPFLYDYYANTDVNSGNAVSLITCDSSSTTFLNILTPANNGFAIGGGTYIKDYTRSVGMLGLMDVCGNFTPNQTIVSGNSIVKYLTTTGINTYVPKTDSYVLDVNGPMRIANGEVNTIFHMNYEVKQMSFAKRNTSYGIAVGSPSGIYSSDSSYPYTQTISYTSNGGKAWTNAYVGLYSIDTQVQYLNTYVYNSNYAFVSSSVNHGNASNILYYTADGGSTWSGLVDSTSPFTNKTFSTMYIYDRKDGSHNLLVGGYDITYNKNRLYYNITNSSFASYSTSQISYSAIDISLSTINGSDGSANFLYLIGNGIQKFDVSGSVPVPQYYINSSSTYNDIFAYDSSYAVAVGGNTISYTLDSKTWQSSSVTNVSGGTFNMKSVYIYDTSNAIAVGDAGIIAYTTNGALTWQSIPSNILNSAGTASRITDSSNSLSSVFMPDLNSFVISNVITTYGTYTDSNSNIVGNIIGNSKILYGFYPNVFNYVNNKVLDVSGSMELTGDIRVTGNLVVSGNVTMNQVVTSVNVSSSYYNITVTNDTSLNGRLLVNSDTSLNGRLFVNLDTSMNGNIVIGGNLTMSSSKYMYAGPVFQF